MSDPAFDRLVLRSPGGASAALVPHGAHLLSWIDAAGMERLFTSRTAELRPGAAIRGGVPVIFPQFAGLGPLPKHGFARALPWRVDPLPGAPPDAAALTLEPSDLTRAAWPAEFRVRLEVRLEDQALRIALSVANTGASPFTFTAALHTYLRVGDVAAVAVDGLAGLGYRDGAAGDRAARQGPGPLTVAGEVDRIYLATRAPVRLAEPGRRPVRSELSGFADTVIWNPGPLKGAALADLEPEGYRRFLCVEAAVIGEPARLAAGATWSGAQRLALG